MNIINTISFNICDLSIKIVFTKTRYPSLYRNLLSQIKKALNTFIELQPVTADFTITFIDTPTHGVGILHKPNENTYYAHIFSQVNKRSLSCYYHISYYQLDRLLGTVIEKLLEENNGFFLHASASIYKNLGYIFTGPSGAGKSTSVLFLYPLAKDFAQDIVAIRKIKNNLWIYQIPLWSEMKVKKLNKSYQLNTVFFPIKSKTNKIVPVNNISIFISKTLEQSWLYNEKNEKALKNRLLLIAQFNNYKFFYFRKSKTKFLDTFQNYCKKNEDSIFSNTL